MAKELSDLEIAIDSRINKFREELIEAIKSTPIPTEYKVGELFSYDRKISGFETFRDSLVKAIRNVKV